MISSAHRTASAIALMVAGTFFPPSNGASLRAARILAAINSTRLRPSSTQRAYHFRFLFVYKIRETVRFCPTVPYRFEGENHVRKRDFGHLHAALSN
jgi:hypothetical protein